jgi:hypothetical protein
LLASIRSSIAARLYGSNTTSLLAVAILAITSVHFANRTETAANHQSGVLELQKESRFEIIFQRHRRLVQAAPAELDRVRLDASRAEVVMANSQLHLFLHEVALDTASIVNKRPG